MVIFTHTGILSIGRFGVDLFFVLSGLLITGILLDAKANGGTGWRTYGRPFYLRRALRILPLGFLALFIALIAFPALGIWHSAPFSQQVWYWTYLSNWYLGPRAESISRVGHFWSLAVEEQFYLCWPWVVLQLNRHQLTRVCLALVVLSPVLRFAADQLSLSVPRGYLIAMTPLHMDGLGAGALLAILSRRAEGLNPLRTWALILAPLGLAWLTLTEAISGAVLAFASIVTLTLTAPSASILQRLLNSRGLRWVGTVSYGLYVIHAPITADVREQGMGSLTNLAITLPASLILAALCWYGFERPILRLKARWPMPSGISDGSTPREMQLPRESTAEAGPIPRVNRSNRRSPPA
jgi:peptidoglycan/LPS O-acetylase OafA/YrhL